MQLQVWTDADFERMSWHDNHVHAIRFVEGQNGEGELVLDIDYILEWQKADGAAFLFRVQPATLVFHGVMLATSAPAASFGTDSIASLAADDQPFEEPAMLNRFLPLAALERTTRPCTTTTVG